MSGKSQIAVTFQLVNEFQFEFMKAVDEELSALAKVKGPDAGLISTRIATALEAIMPILDQSAGVSPSFIMK